MENIDKTPIYTILVTHTCYIDDKTYFPEFGESRLVGFYHDLDTAISKVKENACDIHEYLYDYAIIEKVMPGIYQATEEDRLYFKWTEDFGYVQVHMSDEFKHFIGFGIG